MTRFWEKVAKGKECWEWDAGTNEKGYGVFRYRGRPQLAHRVSYELHYGSFDKDLKVCHLCDNPPCVNPDHLFLGTQKDNVRDCIAKGRFPFVAEVEVCKWGHSDWGTNVRGKYCKACNRERARRCRMLT